ncbi:DoxX family protein [Aquidulcibacter sp.]|uniref:DoxX family protein n=1 Tax=Aquidulcibacter sp. TaxID=2052990 RepID=UPI0025C054A5|nr:DoxX family protein [Aquidulcibacter sp.]
MKPSTILAWGLRIAFATLFGLAAFSKFSGDPQYISEFAKIGFGDWFRFATATLETIGAIGLVIPRMKPWGAFVLLAVTFGATVAQLTVLHVGLLHCALIGTGLLVLIYLSFFPQQPEVGQQS